MRDQANQSVPACIYIARLLTPANTNSIKMVLLSREKPPGYLPDTLALLLSVSHLTVSLATRAEWKAVTFPVHREGLSK